MKKYSEYMDEITPTDLYKGLVAHGLFADRLPPIFTSEGFYEFCEKNKPVFKSKAYGYVYYESIRNTNIPRQLGIPVPMAHELLAKSLTDNWDKIQTYFREKTERQIYKVSRIHVRKMKESKELFEMNYSNWRNDGTVAPDLLIGQKYIVSADISKFFPSIYTHSLTWALTGKQTAKKKRRGEWFNDIDEAVQKTKDCETHGIIIGPHTSNILSEIILTAIDKN